jgi:hypothetical protein
MLSKPDYRIQVQINGFEMYTYVVNVHILYPTQQIFIFNRYFLKKEILVRKEVEEGWERRRGWGRRLRRRERIRGYQISWQTQ